VVASACSGGGKKKAIKPVTLATTSSTTSTTVVVGPPSPVTGLPLDADKANRPLLIVKIDNAPEARPQAGINQADAVLEEMVEGGLTRFAALFQAGDSDPVGPVRSARSTDVSFASALNRPLFAYAGANAVFKVLVARSLMIDVGIDKYPGDYTRARDRKAPHDLFTSTKKLYAHAPDSAKAPPAMFTFRDASTPLASAGAVPVTTVNVRFGTTTATWTWDAASSSWLRSQNGTPHLDAAGKQVAAKNVVIQLVRYTNSGLVDPARNPVPEAQLSGSGEVWVLTDGKLVKGQWQKPGVAQVTQYNDTAGTPIPLLPGQTWIELGPAGSAAAG
jgi:hypothetical protein